MLLLSIKYKIVNNNVKNKSNNANLIILNLKNILVHIKLKNNCNVKNTINFAVQVNGKTRDIIVVNKDTGEGEILELILKKSKAKKYIEKQKIVKTIFVKNKIINFILKK